MTSRASLWKNTPRQDWISTTKKEDRPMASKKPSAELLDLLNQAIAREIQVSVQYMWQHVLWRGVQGYAVRDAFRSTAISEMKHAEAIAERLNYLGGLPTTKTAPIFSGTTIKRIIAT